MIHHLRIYNPKNLRSEHYKSPTTGENKRAAIWGLGLEWVVPVVVLIAVVIVILSIWGVSLRHQALFIGSAVAWSYLMFNTIHDAMHLNQPRVLKIPLIRTWFLRARRFHDIHHIQIDSQGLMNKNFGICFFFMDRIFRTLETKSKPLDKPSYRRALRRYSFIG